MRYFCCFSSDASVVAKCWLFMCSVDECTHESEPNIETSKLAETHDLEQYGGHPVLSPNPGREHRRMQAPKSLVNKDKKKANDGNNNDTLQAYYKEAAGLGYNGDKDSTADEEKKDEGPSQSDGTNGASSCRPPPIQPTEGKAAMNDKDEERRTGGSNCYRKH